MRETMLVKTSCVKCCKFWLIEIISWSLKVKPEAFNACWRTIRSIQICILTWWTCGRRHHHTETPSESAPPASGEPHCIDMCLHLPTMCSHYCSLRLIWHFKLHLQHMSWIMEFLTEKCKRQNSPLPFEAAVSFLSFASCTQMGAAARERDRQFSLSQPLGKGLWLSGLLWFLFPKLFMCHRWKRWSWTSGAGGHI